MPRLTREQSRELTREKLRQSAMLEISHNGFVGASIDRICDNAGFSRGAFYANFSSKEELLADILRTQFSEESDAWLALLRSDRSLEELLPLLRDKFAAYLADRDGLMFAAELQLYAMRNEAFLSTYLEEFLALDFKAEQILEAVYRKGGKLPHRPLPDLASTMRALVSGLVLDTGRHRESTNRSAELLIVFLEDLLSLADPV